MKEKTKILFDKVVNDYHSSNPKSVGKYATENYPAYIYNLFNGGYKFSFKDLSEIMDLMAYEIKGKTGRNCTSDCHYRNSYRSSILLRT